MKVVLVALALVLGAAAGARSDAARPSSQVCRGPGKIIVGTRGADALQGTEGRDTICGLGGHDTIVGRGGHDLILGGPVERATTGCEGRAARTCSTEGPEPITSTARPTAAYRVVIAA